MCPRSASGSPSVHSSQSSTAATSLRDVDDAVAEAIVAVHDRGAVLRRAGAPQLLLDLVDDRELARARARPLLRPTPDLPLDVAVVAREIREADGIEIDGVQIGENVDQVERQVAARVQR